MNIIHFSVWARTFTQFRFELIMSLQKKGIDNILVSSPESPHTETLKGAGFKVLSGKYSKKLDYYIFKSVQNLRCILKKSPSDFLLMHQPMALLIGVVSSLFLRKKLIYFTGGLKSNDSMGYLKRIITNYFELFLLKKCDLILSVNIEDTEYLNKKIATKSIYVGPRGGCGIDTDQFIFNNDNKIKKKVILNVDSSSIVIGVVGRIEKEKGVFKILNHFLTSKIQYNSDIHLLFIGSGSQDETLNEIIKKLPINLKKRIHFVGRQENINEWYSVIDVFVLASLREGMPTSLLEAMSSSCVALTTNVRGAREAIVHGKNGMIFNNINSLCHSITEITFNLSKYHKMRVAARSTVVELYSTKKLLPFTLKIIENIIKSQELLDEARK